jgi:transposase
MDRVVARKLRPWEGRKLQKLKRQLSNAVNCRHARIILLSRGGVANARIAERCGCSPAWVRTVIHRFNRGGIDAVAWHPYYCHRGGPRKFVADVTEQIAEVALSPPQELIGMSVWSLPKLRDYLVAQQVVPSISVERLRQVLRARGGPVASHQDVEGLHRPRVLAQIPQDTPPVRQAPAGRRPAGLRRRVRAAEPAAAARPALRRHRPRRPPAYHLPPHRRRAAHVRGLRHGTRHARRRRSSGRRTGRRSCRSSSGCGGGGGAASRWRNGWRNGGGRRGRG